jgi:hypothetical protein
MKEFKQFFMHSSLFIDASLGIEDSFFYVKRSTLDDHGLSIGAYSPLI